MAFGRGNFDSMVNMNVIQSEADHLDEGRRGNQVSKPA